MSILTLNNEKPGVRRPFRIEDLQYIWQALNQILGYTADANVPHIISGFHVTGQDVEAGTLAYRGKLYYYNPSDVGQITLGNNLYVGTTSTGDVRTLSDGTTQTYSFKNIVSPTNVGLLIGVASVENFNAWRVSEIPIESITNAMLADASISTAKLQPGAVRGDKITTGTIIASLLTQSLAPCYINRIVTLRETVNVRWEINLINYISYSGGQWSIPEFDLTNVTQGTSFYINFQPGANTVNLPQFIPIVLRNTADVGDINVELRINNDTFYIPFSVGSQNDCVTFTLQKVAVPGAYGLPYILTGAAQSSNQ